MNARIERLNELLKQSPQDGFIRFALAKEFEKLGSADRAIKGLQELLRDDPDYIGAYYHLASLLKDSGQLEDAIQTCKLGMEKATKMNDVHARSELQQALANLEEEE